MEGLLNEVLGLGAASVDKIEPTRAAWLEARRRGIGGSDAGAVMGMNPYSSPLMVWLEKRGEDTFKGNAATHWGNILEEPIRVRAAKELMCTIEKPGDEAALVSKELPLMRANLDGLLYAEALSVAGQNVSGLGGWECKTSGFGRGFTGEELPPAYYAQVQHYMAVTGLPWFVLTAFFINEDGARHYFVERNETFIAELKTEEARFWNEHVATGVPPEPTGIEAESRLVASLASGGEMTLPREYEETLDELAEVKARLKTLETRKSTLEETIKLALAGLGPGDYRQGAGAKTLATCGPWRITWNEQSRLAADVEAMKRAGVFEQYAKRSTFKVLRVTKAKEAKA